MVGPEVLDVAEERGEDVLHRRAHLGHGGAPLDTLAEEVSVGEEVLERVHGQHGLHHVGAVQAVDAVGAEHPRLVRDLGLARLRARGRRGAPREGAHLDEFGTHARK